MREKVKVIIFLLVGAVNIRPMRRRHKKWLTNERATLLGYALLAVATIGAALIQRL
jgi:hypothetical protein